MTGIHPLRSEADYDAALKAIEVYFVNEPKPGTAEADRFDLLALVIGDYERGNWEIEADICLKERTAAEKPASQ